MLLATQMCSHVRHGNSKMAAVAEPVCVLSQPAIDYRIGKVRPSSNRSEQMSVHIFRLVLVGESRVKGTASHLKFAGRLAVVARRTSAPAIRSEDQGVSTQSQGLLLSKQVTRSSLQPLPLSHAHVYRDPALSELSSHQHLVAWSLRQPRERHRQLRFVKVSLQRTVPPLPNLQ